MKKLGTGVFFLGLIILMAAGIRAIKAKKDRTNVEAAQSHPFPWYPLTGGILVASGIIMMSKKEQA